MSQPPLKKIDDEQLLGTGLAIELEDVKKSLAQLKLEKPKPTHSESFCFNVDYCIKKICNELDNIDSCLQKLKT